MEFISGAELLKRSRLEKHELMSAIISRKITAYNPASQKPYQYCEDKGLMVLQSMNDLKRGTPPLRGLNNRSDLYDILDRVIFSLEEADLLRINSERDKSVNEIIKKEALIKLAAEPEIRKVDMIKFLKDKLPNIKVSASTYHRILSLLPLIKRRGR